MALNRFFNNLPIAKKITTIIAIAALVTGLGGGTAATYVAHDIMNAAIKEQSSQASKSTAQQLKLYLTSVEQDLLQFANNTITVNSINEFTDAWNSLENPQKYLQKHYIHKNSHPVGNKDKLTNPEDGSYYSEVHSNYHDRFVGMKDIKGYYDIFLINKNGNVVYSVYKETDYATNMNNGEWKSTDLGEIFREVHANPQKGKTVFKDFRAYAPSNNVPASFMATPIFDKNNQYQGVMVFQMPVDRFSNFFHSDNPEHTVYMVGSDGTLRNDLKETEGNDILKAQTKLENVAQLQGKFIPNLPGLLFDKSTYNIQKLSFGNTDWTLVLEQNQKPIDAKNTEVTLYSLIATLLSSLLVACLGFLYARSFARPISKLADTVDKLASGYDVDIPCKDNLDELGTLARSLTSIYHKSQESARVEAAVDGADAMFMIANEEFKIVYANKKIKDSFNESNAYFRKNMSECDIDDLGNNTIINFLEKDIPNIRTLLKGLHKSCCEKVVLDNRTFAVMLTPVYDKSGNRIGFVTEWAEKTIEVQLSEVIQSAAYGNFKDRLDTHNATESDAAMSKGINQICDTVDNFLNNLNNTVHAFADGDLTQALSGDYQGQFSEVQTSLNQSFNRLRDTIREIASVGNAIKAASSDITTGADNLSGRTEAQAASIEQTVATMEEMSASVRNNANSAVQASNLAQETLQQAENGRAVVSQAVTAMNQIETSAHRITEIVSVIDSIASQTNLLALNAAVEAARAGEAGKGFAVVASEVRTLASRCSEAARDIRGLITGSNAQVVDGVKLVNATGVALSQIVESVTNVTATISSISQASREQATGIEEISGAISQMDEITQQNAGLADNSASNARELSKEAEALSDLVRAFKTETAASMLSSVNKKLTSERPAHNKAKKETPAIPKQDNFSDFGAASGDDWSSF